MKRSKPSRESAHSINGLESSQCFGAAPTPISLPHSTFQVLDFILLSSWIALWQRKGPRSGTTAKDMPVATACDMMRTKWAGESMGRRIW